MTTSKTITVHAIPMATVKLTLNDRSLSMRKTIRELQNVLARTLPQSCTKSQSASEAVNHHDIAFRYILRAAFEESSRTLSVAYVHKKSKVLHVTTFEGTVEETDTSNASAWAESVMKAVYDDAGIKRYRHLKVLVNPFSGTASILLVLVKKGINAFTKKVKPMLDIAGCRLDVIYTTHHGHAKDIAKMLPLDFDAVVTVSGDGLVHEVMNGFAEHADPVRAFQTPVAPIPTGSGNGLSLNLLGLEEGFDIVAATLNIIKGQPMPVDLFSVTQGGKRTISFMSQALGLMADLDIGTEHLRWMGDTRFIYGLLRGLITFKSCPVQLSFRLAENDKEKMAAEFAARQKGIADALHEPRLPTMPLPENIGQGLPPLQHTHEGTDGWTIFDEPLLFVYAGKGPYVGRDYMAFPVSVADDGLIDIIAMAKVNRSDILTSMDGAPKGDGFWHPHCHYIKAHAYRVKPLEKEGCLSVDGEVYPFEEYQVEVHKGLGNLLSLHGQYAGEFGPRPKKL